MTSSITYPEWGAGIPAGGSLLYHLADPIIHPPEQETRAEPPWSFMTREELFLTHLAQIERTVSWVCARRGLRGADAEDFASTVKLRLIENHYEVLGKFEGRSSLQTFLAAVINHMYLDFQDERFGKWRSSAQAKRLGPVAVRLERLVYRDNLTFDDAVGVLLTDEGVAMTREELHEIFLQLPRRPGRRTIAVTAHEPSTMSDGPLAVAQAERQELVRKAIKAIRRALERMPALDRVFLRLYFEKGLTVAQAARHMGVDQKALYRRQQALLRMIQIELEAEGVRKEDLDELVSEADWSEDLWSDDDESDPSGKDGER